MRAIVFFVFLFFHKQRTLFFFSPVIIVDRLSGQRTSPWTTSFESRSSWSFSVSTLHNVFVVCALRCLLHVLNFVFNRCLSHVRKSVFQHQGLGIVGERFDNTCIDLNVWTLNVYCFIFQRLRMQTNVRRNHLTFTVAFPEMMYQKIRRCIWRLIIRIYWRQIWPK